MKQATEFKVEGMTCGGCVASVKRALDAAGVQAEVSLQAGTATVREPVDPDVVREAVEGAGFDYGGPVSR